MLLFELQPDAVVPDLAITAAAPLSSSEVMELELQVSKSRADAVAAAKSPRLKGPAVTSTTHMGDAAAPSTTTITYPPSVPPSSDRIAAAAAAAAAAGPVRFADVAEHMSMSYADAESKYHEHLRLVSPGGWGASPSSASAAQAVSPGGLMLSPGGLSAELASFLEEEAASAAAAAGSATPRQQDDDGYDDDDHSEIVSLKEELSESGGETPMDLGDSGHGFALDALVGEDAEATATAVAAAATAPIARAKRGANTKRKAKPKPKGGRKAQRQTESTSTSATAAAAATSPARPVPRSSPNGRASKRTKRASGAAGKHGTTVAAAAGKPSTPLPVVAFDASGVLPKDHKPARGRGRHLQLQTMTTEQIEAESVARQEKNRLAARECRMRRKNHVSGLEDRITALKKKEQRSQAIIAKLRAKLAEYEKAGKAK